MCTICFLSPRLILVSVVMSNKEHETWCCFHQKQSAKSFKRRISQYSLWRSNYVNSTEFEVDVIPCSSQIKNIQSTDLANSGKQVKFFTGTVITIEKPFKKGKDLLPVIHSVSTLSYWWIISAKDDSPRLSASVLRRQPIPSSESLMSKLSNTGTQCWPLGVTIVEVTN